MLSTITHLSVSQCIVNLLTIEFQVAGSIQEQPKSTCSNLLRKRSILPVLITFQHQEKKHGGGLIPVKISFMSKKEAAFIQAASQHYRRLNQKIRRIPNKAPHVLEVLRLLLSVVFDSKSSSEVALRLNVGAAVDDPLETTVSGRTLS